MHYINIFLILRKGSAIFFGENISSIIILRDILTREATKRKIKLDVYCGILHLCYNVISICPLNFFYLIFLYRCY